MSGTNVLLLAHLLRHRKFTNRVLSSVWTAQYSGHLPRVTELLKFLPQIQFAFCKNQMFHPFHTYSVVRLVLDNRDRYLTFTKKIIKFESSCTLALYEDSEKGERGESISKVVKTTALKISREMRNLRCSLENVYTSLFVSL